MDKKDIDYAGLIKKIVSESINAPSGDNCQPWYFSVNKNKLNIFKKNNGNNYLDFKSRGTLIAHGALIQNIIIVANFYSFNAEIVLFPDVNEKNLISEITFLMDAKIPKKPHLYYAIKERGTNRKKYNKKILTKEHKDYLLNSCTNTEVKVNFLESEKEKETLFFSTTQMERVALQNKFLHSMFFKSIVWSSKDESHKKEGLFLKTMELPLPIEIFFKLLRFWPIAKILSKIGFSKKVAQSNRVAYQTSSGVFILSVKDLTSESFIETGRIMEKIWLSATHCNIAVQPLAGLLYTHQRLVVEKNMDSVLSLDEISIIEKNYNAIEKISNIDKDHVVSMILRIGYAAAPSASSSKKEPEFL